MIPAMLTFTTCGLLHSGYAWVTAFLAIAAAYPLKKQGRMMVNYLTAPSFWLLAAFGVSYALFSGGGWRGLAYYALLPLMAYAVGWCGAEQGGVRDQILGLTLGFALHACLNALVNFGNSRYQLVDFWSGSFRTATGSGFLNTMIFSAAAYSLFLERRRWMKLLLLTATAVCLGYALQLGTRTQLVILAATLGMFCLTQRKLGSRVLAVLVCLAAGIWLCCRLNVLGLGDFVSGSNLMARITEGTGLRQSNAERLGQFFKGLRNLYDHPLGGRAEEYYYHNLWLDVGRVAGVIPLVPLLAFQLTAAVHVLRLCREERQDAGLRCLLGCVWLGLFLNAAVEPVLEGMLDLFLAFCAVSGMADGRDRRRGDEG